MKVKSIYVNDPAYFMLTPWVRLALDRGQITPREAGESLMSFYPFVHLLKARGAATD